MKWVEVNIHTTNEAIEPISNLLNEVGANGTITEDPADLTKEKSYFFGEMYDLDPNDYPKEGVLIKAYFHDNDLLQFKLTKIKQYMTELEQIGFQLRPKTITINKVEESDWENEWKKYYKPVKITDNITIVPTWEQYTPASNEEKVIELDPGMAFGTGTHPTTILSAQALEKYVHKTNLVLDVGCGSGILSIVAAALGAGQVYAYDLDEVAVSSTRINADLNFVKDKIISEQNDLLKGIEKQADVIVSNILAEIIMKFTDDAWNNLKAGGLFITSGIISSKQQDVKTQLEKSGFHIIEKNELNGWISFIAKK
ncbi:50S ribosomal protein L11 methyltransferase [Virgibacillus sp. W0181]|uniref:50S ribosomal protein L11 methyltransferase n=1 Tax=Virgibacillus sp. W0181 TaxID=3391581 RepID=UPI003F479883